MRRVAVAVAGLLLGAVTGRQLWKSARTGTDNSTAPLAYGSGKLVAMDDGDRFEDKHAELRALNPATGKMLWKKKLAAPRYNTITHSTDKPVTVRGRVAYLDFGFRGDNYMAVDVVTGKTKWTVYGTNDFSLGQSVSSNRVFYGSGCNWAARTLGGKQVWRDDRGCSGGVWGTTPVLAGNRLWLHEGRRSNWVVDARNDKLLFDFDSNSVPAVVGKKAFVTSKDRSGVDGVWMQAISSSTGAVLWSRRPSVDKFGSIVGPPVATSKVVYVTTGQGQVVGYSTTARPPGSRTGRARPGGSIDPQSNWPHNEGSAIGGGVLAVPVTNWLAVFG